jgi:hypothetical protein
MAKAKEESVLEQAYLVDGSPEQGEVIQDAVRSASDIPDKISVGENPFKVIYREAQPRQGVQKYVLGFECDGGVMLRVVDYNGGSGVSSSLIFVPDASLEAHENGETFNLINQ